MLVVGVVVQFYLCFNFNFLLFKGIVIYDNEFETKKSKSKPRINLTHMMTTNKKIS